MSGEQRGTQQVSNSRPQGRQFEHQKMKSAARDIMETLETPRQKRRKPKTAKHAVHCLIKMMCAQVLEHNKEPESTEDLGKAIPHLKTIVTPLQGRMKNQEEIARQKLSSNAVGGLEALATSRSPKKNTFQVLKHLRAMTQSQISWPNSEMNLVRRTLIATMTRQAKRASQNPLVTRMKKIHQIHQRAAMK